MFKHLTTAALMAAGVACAPAPVMAQNQEVTWVYSIKYVCGAVKRIGDERIDNIVADGFYRTEINILNERIVENRLRKRVIPLVQLGEGVTREPDQIGVKGGEDIGLDPVHATMDDCYKIGEMLGQGPLADQPLSVGFLVIESLRPLRIEAVYTTGDFETQTAPSIVVRRVGGRRSNVRVLQE